MRTRALTFDSLAAVLAFIAVAIAPHFSFAASPPAADPLAGLNPEHPRLVATARDWELHRERIERVGSDPHLLIQHEALLAEARRLLDAAPLRREMTGRRLLGTSRTLLGRVAALGYAWQMTGDTAFARRAETEMLAAAAFSDWNPSHFLDTAEAATALALGYDWCHDALTPEARAAIRDAIADKALRPGLDPAATHNWWHVSRHNWSQVCFGGLTLGALAIATEEPALAREVLALARAGIGNGLAPYAPAGVYPEGPSYWAYGTSYQVLMITALESALGTDWGLPASNGFLPSAGALLQTTGPSGKFYNFADGGLGGEPVPAVHWFARRLNDPGLLLFNRRLMGALPAEPDRLAAPGVLWWPESAPADAVPSLPLRWLGRGPNPVGVFRESWTDPRALYLAFKGGAASLNHAHMDAGSFILEADGVRWAIDLGLQNYESLESKGVDLWSHSQDSQRWQVYRLGNRSHGTLTIDGELHRVDGHGRVSHFSDDPADPRAIVDISPVFVGKAANVRRGFRLLPDRGVLVQDELTGLQPGTSVRWQMPTRASAAADGSHAVLTQDGRTLRAHLLAPAGAAFTVESAAPPDDGFNAPNPGVSLLVATLTAPADGALRIAVVLNPGDAAVAPQALRPLDAWVSTADIVAAPKPLFRDPVFDGAADPVVVWNPAAQRWWMFYTNRRANQPGLSGVAWVHGCRIGIAESADGGVTWSYLATAKVDLPPEIGGAEPTHWAPDVITGPDGLTRHSSEGATAVTHHMYLTVVPGIFENWQHPRRIVHLTSSDLRNWKYESALELASDRVIDARVFPLPGGGWRMWYNNERDAKSIYHADSADLFTWTDKGKTAGVGERPGEGPYVFQWKGAYWMLVDLWKGLGVYRSDDLEIWTAQQGNLLDVPGKGADDGVNGGHPGVVVSNDRAFVFYFTHPGRSGTISPDDKDNLELRRSSIQVVELVERDGILLCDRDAPTAVRLIPPSQ